MGRMLSLQVLPTTTEADSGRSLNKNASFGSDNSSSLKSMTWFLPASSLEKKGTVLIDRTWGRRLGGRTLDIDVRWSQGRP